MNCIDVFNLKPEDIKIEDIITALPNICRFGGRINTHYSVAQHCVELARWLSNNNKVELVPLALLHDACEAYIGDIIYPIKSRIPTFLELEDNIMYMIYQKYGINSNLQQYFDIYDKSIVINEMKALDIYDTVGHLTVPNVGLNDLVIEVWDINKSRREYKSEIKKYFGNII